MTPKSSAQFMMRVSSRLSHAALRTVLAASGKRQPETCHESENETADIVQSLEEILERLKRQVPVRVAADVDPAMHAFPPSTPAVAWALAIAGRLSPAPSCVQHRPVAACLRSRSYNIAGR